MARGLLFSQIGYDPSFPAKIAVRAEAADFLSKDARCELLAEGGTVARANCVAEGEQWKVHWWTATFPAGLAEGEYSVRVVDGDEVVFSEEGLRVRSGILWNATVEMMAVEMLEARARVAPANCGWQDAGGVWQESNTQSATILGLCDLIEFASARLRPETTQRIFWQMVHGCEYLLRTQEKAASRGHPAGALSHDLLGHEDDVLPADALKAVVAWRRAARFLPAGFDAQRNRFNAAADRALQWLTTGAEPMGDKGFTRRQRGLPPKTEIPTNEWMTRDLVTLAWSAVESYRAARYEAGDLAVETARAIMARQIPQERAEGPDGQKLWGHFKEFESLPHSEKAWCHSIYDGQFGADAGGAFPHYLIPLAEMLKLWPEHEDAPRWRECLRNFAEGYLLPACGANPFQLAPYGVFGDEGLIHFAGPWHGFNCVYAYTAALALELARLLDLPELRGIAYANLQWICGLNAGLTAGTLDLGSHIFRMDIEPGVALPCSMIHGVGNRTAGTWFATRGVIASGFATGETFTFDTDPTRCQDAPSSFSDEEWIVHNAAWLSALARLH